MHRVVLLCALLAVGLVPLTAPAEVLPQAVVALIDTGINPYSLAFRDGSALAQQHPSTYLPGYPPPCEDVEPGIHCAWRLELTLGALPMAEALEADAQIWEEDLVRGRLYWIPGTKIVGAISFGGGGVNCGNLPDIPPVTDTANGFFCSEHIILDDQGHGTMTASRATATLHSLGAAARVVMIEGLGAESSTWAAERPWIDVQSNSWGSAVPALPGGGATAIALKRAAEKQLVLVASGNGTGFSGVAPQPTHTQPTLPPGVVIVGAHDNGHVTAWSGAPAHIVTDGYGGYAAAKDSTAHAAPRPNACCTSASSPYAAGGAAAILLHARGILGDAGVGVHDGVVASGPAGLVPAGPLADGELTLGEWRSLLLATAQARPVKGDDDGLMHFLGGPTEPAHPEHGTGENPFCQFCWTLPIEWRDVPAEVPAYASIGYGAVNEHAVALARDVLLGEAPLPLRPDEDAFFELDDAIRRAYFGS